MKKYTPVKLLVSFLGIATFASLVGTVSGTLAWYAYATRATLSYSGTSVSNTVQLQIGIASEKRIASYSGSEMIEVTYPDDPNDQNYYYFAPLGVGLSSSAINAYLEANGFATNSLVPATSGAYNRGDSFYLKQAPNEKLPFNSQATRKDTFATIPFVFRIVEDDTTNPVTYASDQELWLTDIKVQASDDEQGNVFKAIRIFVDRGDDYEDDFILNPSATAAGSTKVGGLLDLSRDGYYDFDSRNREVIYGEYDSTDGLSETGYNKESIIKDVNGSGKTNPDTFTAKHYQGVKYYDSLDACGIKSAAYESLSSIMPKRNDFTGKLENVDPDHSTAVCKTAGDEGHNLGRVDMTIYLEGWDFNVIDEEYEHKFDLGLTFEINKVGLSS